MDVISSSRTDQHDDVVDVMSFSALDVVEITCCMHVVATWLLQC